jgi:predicted enzyme related to lactoylglutathione lyase
MKPNPVGWFEIYVQDMPRARTFYEAVFQVKLECLMDSPDIEMWNFPMAMDEIGAAGVLAKMAGMPAGGNSILVYFSCEDCAVEAGRVTKAGGQLHKSKTSIGEYGYIALALDTEGNMIGLHSRQ